MNAFLKTFPIAMLLCVIWIAVGSTQNQSSTKSNAVHLSSRSDAKASNAVGVYWGEAGATHDPKFFISVAQDQDPASRLMLWTGVSIGRERDRRRSLLSLGMQQLTLPDLLLIAPKQESLASRDQIDQNDAPFIVLFI